MKNLWSNLSTQEHLTYYAERRAYEQWQLWLEMKCVQVSDNKHWVYKPDHTYVDESNDGTLHNQSNTNMDSLYCLTICYIID